MQYTRLAESEEYRQRREALRLAEVELIENRERVAALRRALPPGPVVDDYTFLEGPSDLDAGDDPVNEVRIHDLFTAPGRSLVVYHFMFGKAHAGPCPMCTMWIDGFNGLARHLKQNVDFVVVAAADPAPLRAHARRRGWNQLRLLSAGTSTFKLDLGSELDDGGQISTVSVFDRDETGAVRHRYTARPQIDTDVHERGIDALCATWNVLDLTPQGRGDWYSALDY